MDYKSHRSLINAAIKSKRRSLLNEQDAMGTGVRPNPLLDPRAAQQTQEEVARVENARSILLASKEQQDRERDLTLLHLNPQRAEVIYSIGLGREVDPSKLKTLSPEIEKEFETPTIFPAGQDGKVVAGSDPRYAEGVLRELGQLSKGEEALISVLKKQQAEADFYGTGTEHASKVMMAIGPTVALTQVNWQSKTKPTPSDLAKGVKRGQKIEDLVGENYRFNSNWIDNTVAANPDLFDEDTLKKAMDTMPSTPSPRNKANIEAREQIKKYIDTREKRRTANRNLAVAELTDFVIGDKAFEQLSLDLRTGQATKAPADLLTASDEIAQKQILTQLSAQKHDLELGKGLSKDSVKLVADSIGLNYDSTRGYRIGKNYPLTLTGEGFDLDLEQARKELNINSKKDIPGYDSIVENLRGINETLKQDVKGEVSRKMERLFDLAYADAVNSSKDLRVASNLPSSVDTKGAKPAVIGDMSEAVREALKDQLVGQAKSSTRKLTLDDMIKVYESIDPAAISVRRQGMWKAMSELQYTNTDVDSSGKILKIRDSETDLQKARKVIDVATGYRDTMGKIEVARPTITDRLTIDDNGNLIKTTTPENFNLDTLLKSKTLVWDPSTKQWKFFEDTSKIFKPLGPEFSIQTSGLSPEHEKLIQRMRIDYGDAPEVTGMGRAVTKAKEVAKALLPGVAGFATGASTAFLLGLVDKKFIPREEYLPDELVSASKSALSMGAAGTVGDYLENMRGRKPQGWGKSILRGGGPAAAEGFIADLLFKALNMQGNETTELVGAGAALASLPFASRAASAMAPVSGPLAFGLNVAIPLGAETFARGVVKSFEPRKKTPMEERLPDVVQGMSEEDLNKLEETRRRIIGDFTAKGQLAKSNNIPIFTVPQGLDISGLGLEPGQNIYYDTPEYNKYIEAILRNEAKKMKTPPQSPSGLREGWYPKSKIS